MTLKKYFLVLCCAWLAWFVSFKTAYSQELKGRSSTVKAAPGNWFLLDAKTDHVEGMSVNKAYRKLLKRRPAQDVIVAVIDAGVDIEHEDLKHAIWVNEDEVPENGIDDDENGYVDDVHGWNFIGGSTGNVNHDTHELTREYVRLSARFNRTEDTLWCGEDREEYAYYETIKKRFEHQLADHTEKLKLYRSIYERTTHAINSLKLLIPADTLSADVVSSLRADTPSVQSLKEYVLYLFDRVLPSGSTLENFLTDLEKQITHFRESLQYVYNASFDPRPIVGDRYEDPYEKGYGNNDVKGPEASHGTHVAGIIAADRNNGTGIRGIAEHVRIMPIRAVPNGGDERDKDVANAIIYAVDNGAKVVNMSFGKSLSPRKEAVDRAIQYAEDKGVLLVHAAGNSGEDIDVKPNFPSQYGTKHSEAVATWLEVGASSWRADKTLPAEFSNYGQKTVDVFAPGTRIRSTLPNNSYGIQQGTSMASPMVAAVAALLFVYFPHLSALQVKDIISRSAQRYAGLLVAKPGGGEHGREVEFAGLSKTGGRVDVYKAVKMAKKIRHQRH